MTEKKQENRGGIRPGSGRKVGYKKDTPPTKKHTVRLTKDQHEKIVSKFGGFTKAVKTLIEDAPPLAQP